MMNAGLPPPPPGLAAPAAPAPMNNVAVVGGLVPVIPMSQIVAEETARASLTQNAPIITGLAAHVRRCFDAAYEWKRTSGIEERLQKCVRQRRGEYDPEILAEIKKSGGSEIYMMLTANKCRAAASWVKDVMFGTREESPWDIEATSDPSLPPPMVEEVVGEAGQEALQLEMQMGQDMMNPERMQEIVQRIYDKRMTLLKERATKRMDRMRGKMEDQLQEGGFNAAMDAFVDDLVTFPFAIVKGPVPRKRKRLTWVPALEGDWKPDIKDVIQLEWERVDPFKIYWAPHATGVDDGFLIEHHQLTRPDLEALDGVEGYDTAAIRGVLDEYGKGGLRDWLLQFGNAESAMAQGQSLSGLATNPEATIDALQLWGNVQGKELIEWGMDAKQVPDPLKNYDCEIWAIGRWVIKAELNANPYGCKPYYKTSYEKVPGSFAGNGVADLVRDTARICNAAARALVNNMGIASGPMVWVNTQRLAEGENVTQLYPWRIFQGVSDPYNTGGQKAPIEFFQPNSNVAELMALYEKFSTLADEYSGVPRYMTGDSPAGGAGRTASGLSMLMNNAGKSIKQVIGNIDMDVTRYLIERLYYYNMKYSEDPELKGDVRVVARGVNVLVAKEAAQVRMNEILNIVGSNPILIDIVGEEAIADLLREITKPLNMNIVPDREVIRARMLQKQQMMMLQAMAGAGEGGNVTEGQTRKQGPKVMPGNRQRLMNSAPVTDNFSPSRS